VQNNITAANTLAGEAGDQWLEGAVESGVDFVYDNVLKPVGNGIIEAGKFVIDGIQSIPQKLADIFLPQIPMPQLSFNIDSIINGGSFIDGYSFNMQGTGGNNSNLAAGTTAQVSTNPSLIDSIYDNIIEPVGDGIIEAGTGIFGENPNILGALDGWSQAGWLGKAGRILAAPFVYAGHVGYNTTAMIGGTILQPGSPIDLTYGSPGTAFGLGFGFLNILAGGEATIRNGTVQFNDAPLMGSDSGISFGPILHGGKGFNKIKDWGHEYGHTNQNRILGPLYLPVIGIPSILSAGLGLNSSGHTSFWTETWANKWGIDAYKRREKDTN
jgi:hypothetical protein